MMDSLHEALVGIPVETRRSVARFSSNPPGVFGRAHAFFSVTELQGRKQLHWHELFWTGMPHWLTQRAAGASEDLGAYIGATLAAAFSANAPPNMLAAGLLRREANVNNYTRPAYSCPPPPGADIAEWGLAASSSFPHVHCLTCRKGKIGECSCRLDYDRPTCTNSTPVTIGSAAAMINNQRQVFPRPLGMEAPPHLPANDEETLHECFRRIGVPGGDTRCLDYPLLRPSLGVNAVAARVSIHDLLLRQYRRLLTACERTHIDPVEVAADANDEVLTEAVAAMMRNLNLGDAPAGEYILENAAVYEAIQNWPDDRRLAFCDYMTVQNARLGETNLAISAAFGCSINAQPIVSSESAIRSIFYIIGASTSQLFFLFARRPHLIKRNSVSYFFQITLQKTPYVFILTFMHLLHSGPPFTSPFFPRVSLQMKPQDLLGFVKAARERCLQFPGCAPNGEDPTAGTRPITRLASVVLNGATGAVETGMQQCGLNVCGEPAHKSSCKYSFVFSSPALRNRRD
jgi:hypothetical protein